MKEFTDLEVWREAHKLTLIVYKATQQFPREEQFGLTSQVRRSVRAARRSGLGARKVPTPSPELRAKSQSSSVAANIAEGHGRYSNTEFRHFCNIAHGSLSETQCHLIVARDLGYLYDVDWKACYAQIVSVRRLLRAFMRHLSNPEPRAPSQEPSP